MKNPVLLLAALVMLLPAPGTAQDSILPAASDNALAVSLSSPDNSLAVTQSSSDNAASRPADSAKSPTSGKTVSPVAGKGAKSSTYISMDFTDVDLPVLVKFMSEQTKKNFIFDEKVQGKITIISPRKISLDEAYDVFLSVLQVKGFTTIEQGNAIKIVPLSNVKHENLSTSPDGGGAGVSEFVTRLVPLRFVDSSEIVPLLAPMMSKEGMTTSFPSSNTLILIDTRANIDRMLRILSELDAEGATTTIRFFQLKNASAGEVGKTLEAIYQEAPSAGPGAPAPPGGRPRVMRPGKARGSSIKVIPDLRTNSVIVLAGKDLMADIEDLVGRIDITAPENTGKINVYYLENSDAEEMAKVLSTLADRRSTPGTPTSQPGQPATVKSVIAAELEGGVRITADKATNSLIVIASMNDYQTLVEVIKKLDTRRRQVYVEALIMEVTLDKSRDVGVEYRGAVQTGGKSGAVISGTNFDFKGNVNDLFGSIAAGNPLVFGGTGLIAGGLGGSVTLPDGTKIPAITAILRAAQTNENVNILSTPHLLTLDNKDAEIIVGENVPFITSQSRDSTNLNNVINNIERKDVGITLKITPHIHESDFVNLDIFQESSLIQTNSLLNVNQVGPTTLKRSAKTSVLVRSGDTIVLGGMMQDVVSTIRRQVPFLGDIPIIGNLFKFSSVSRKKTNMLILITPRIIKNPQDISGIAADRQKALDKFIEENKGEVERLLPDKKEAGSK